jgi:CHASE3 domain sensor protein
MAKRMIRSAVSARQAAGITGQTWMLIVPAIIVVSILISWWLRP